MRIAIDEARAGQRLDKVVAAVAGLGRARARVLFEQGRVWVWSGDRRRAAQKGARAVAGSEIEIAIVDDELSAQALPDASLALTLLLERDDLVVIDKPAGVPSAPIRRGERGTVANALVARYPEMAALGFSAREPGLCHRLDTGTSGILLAARTPAAFAALTRALRAGEMDKRYLAVCRNALDDQGEIDVALANDPRDPRRVIACDDELTSLAVRPAVTRWRVLERAGDRCLVEARAARAHRHQVRVHLAHLGAPIAGDSLYGGEPALEGRHALHASQLAWRGGDGVAAFEARSPLPPALRALLA